MTGTDGDWDTDTQYGTASLSISGTPTQVVRIEGDIDLANAHDIDRRIRSAYAADVEHVVIDLRGATYLDSAGLAMLVRISSRLTAARSAMTVVAPSQSVASRVIALSGLAGELRLRDDTP